MEQEFEYLKKQAEDYRQEPSERVWSSIENGISHDVIQKKLSVYKYLSIAAIFIGILATVLVVQLYAKQDNPNLFAYSASNTVRPLIIEQLEDVEDSFYTDVATQRLSNAYKEAFFIYNSPSVLKLNKVN